MDDIRLSVKPQMALVVDKCETATEKIEELTKFKEKIVQEIDDTINNISSGYIYCEKCGKWYKNRAWEVKVIEMYSICYRQKSIILCNFSHDERV